MTHGIQVWDAAGTLVLDSSVAFGGVCIGVHTYPAASSATLTYPSLAGRTVKVRMISVCSIDTGVSVDYALGYPRVNVAVAGALTRNFSLWAE